MDPGPKPIIGSWDDLGPLEGIISFHSPAKSEDTIH